MGCEQDADRWRGTRPPRHAAPTTGRLSRRRFLGRIAALGVSTMALAALLDACGDSGGYGAGAQPTAAKGGIPVAAAGSTPGGAAAPSAVPHSAGDNQVTIDNFTFTPATLTVPVGTEVTWTNHDDIPHTVASKDKRFTSPALDTDDHFAYRFTVPGTYAYVCSIHPIMTGQIIVQ